MAKLKGIIPLAAAERILRNAGAERTSFEANEKLRRVLEEYGKTLSLDAIRMANHAGRRTVKEEDISLAAIR